MRLHLLIAVLLLFAACKKKEAPAPPSQPPPPAKPPVSECKKIPAPPAGFIWQDSLAKDRNVNAFFYSPVNGEEVIVVINGDFPDSYKLVTVNLRTHAETFLANIDQYLPSVSQQGCNVFSGPDNNIYKVRTNGEGLQQLTFTSGAHDAKWNAAGTHFFYIQDAQGSLPARLNLAKADGGTINSWPLTMTYFAPLHKSNKIIVQERTSNIVTLYLMDLDSNSRKDLLHAPFDHNNESTPFRNLSVNESDNLLFWSNKTGIFMHDISESRTDTLFKTCETVIYDRPMIGRLNEITFSKHVISVLEPVYLLHQYIAVEYNVVTKEQREIKVY